jgi:hypothetical protein
MGVAAPLATGALAGIGTQGIGQFTNNLVNPFAGFGNPLKRKPNITSSVDDVGKSFKSEIDWGAWNKEILDNPQLMNEYNAIEQQAKANGTWMKNPDGSKFVGTKPTQKELDFHGVDMTPDEAVKAQWIQQNSSNLKMNMPNSFKNKSGSLQGNYHNTNSAFDSFNEQRFGTSSDDGWYGKGTYTSPDSKYTKHYGKNRYDLYINSENPGIIDKKNIEFARHYNRTSDEIAKNIGYDRASLIQDANNNKFASFMNSGLTELPSILKQGFTKHYNMLYEKALKQAEQNKGILDHFTSLHNPYNKETVTPFSNYLKSAIGNNGMFDMTNPNIYKGLAPIGVGAGIAATQAKNEPYKNGGKIKPKSSNWEIVSDNEWEIIK